MHTYRSQYRIIEQKEILDLLINYNKLNSEEIKYYLLELCNKGNVELISSYLNETVENESNDLVFKIDKADSTTSLFKIKVNFE